MEQIVDFFEHYLSLLNSFPLVIQIALVFIIFNAIVALFFSISMYIIRRKKKREEQLIKELRPDIKKMFLSILNDDNQYSDYEVNKMFIEKFGKLDKENYLALIPTLEDIILENQDYLSATNYLSIIKGLKIDSYLEKKLDFSDTRTRLRAFQSLSRLDLTVSDSKILPHTYSKNTLLKKESRASYIGISNNDPFKFFDQVDSNLNYWDQISLLKQFEQHHIDKLPNFSKWIKYSSNSNQTIFLIRAVSYFKQINSSDALIDLLDTSDHSIRKEAILALGRMRVSEVEEKIISIYNSQPVECQVAIIEAVAYIQSGNSLEFLEKAYHTSSNPDVKKLAAEVIYLYGDQGKNLFNKLCVTETGFNLLILEHVRNPLIPSKLKDYYKKEAMSQEYSYSQAL